MQYAEIVNYTLLIVVSASFPVLVIYDFLAELPEPGPQTNANNVRRQRTFKAIIFGAVRRPGPAPLSLAWVYLSTPVDMPKRHKRSR